jgi:hypothetical protein
MSMIVSPNSQEILVQIDVDFEVFKVLTMLRESEADSYNAVIRRLLKLPIENALAAYVPNAAASNPNENALLRAVPQAQRKGLFGSGKYRNALAPDASVEGILSKYLKGAWFNNVHFPEGTKFRATYKGRTFLAEIKGSQWIGEDGIARSSPSDAASAISHTNVNGWRFWFVQMPGDPAWRRMDELRA